MNKALESLLPKAGPGRWWKIELVKNVTKDPIKVSLMQSQVEGRTALSEALGFSRTIAVQEKVIEAAEQVIVMVGGYADVIGSYGLQKGES